jgi:hypothetical protein
MTHQILVSSPAGSGMNFAINLLRLAYDREALGKTHERKDIEEAVPQIAILRNPYDTIASGAERWATSSNHKSFLNDKDLVEDSDIDGIKRVIGWEEKRYLDFFKDIENLKHVKVLSFELLTKDSAKFIKEAGIHFGINLDANKVIDSYALAAVESSGNENRVPREKFTVRKTIEDIINEKYSKENWECWKVYSDIKAKLDKEGL